MKIRFWDRLILFFGALLAMLAGAALVLLPIPAMKLAGENMALWMQIASGAAGVLLVLLGGYLLMFPRRYRSRKREFVVQQTENGELRIAMHAIENLVQRCIDMHEEIHVVSMYIRNRREGVVIDLRISLANNISIPLAVASLQKQIKQYLVASSGIEVQEVRVAVETAQDAAGNSPYLVRAEEAPEKTAEPREGKGKKQPLHQRIFARDTYHATEPQAPAAPEQEEQPKEEPVPVVSEAPAEEAKAEETEQTASDLEAQTEESPKEEADDE